MSSAQGNETLKQPTRRTWIKWLGTTPLAMLVGCSGKPSAAFSGELLQPDLSVGHRIRDGWKLPQPTGAPSKHAVVIVGGGIAGLSAAWELQRQGIQDVVILEMESTAGGTSRSGKWEASQFPWAAHYVPVPMSFNRDLLELFQEMNIVTDVSADGQVTVAEEHLCREPEERVFHQGRWLEGLYPASIQEIHSTDRQQLEQFQLQMNQWAQRRDEQGRRAFAIPMQLGTDSDPEVIQLDQISMAQWMTDQGYDSEALRWLVDYGCRDDYGLTLEQTSAWAGVFYFASRLSGQANSIAEMESQPVMTWPQGNGKIVQHLSQRFAKQIRTEHAVTKITKQPNGQSMRVTAYDKARDRMVELIANDVVFAAPQFLASRLIDQWQQAGRDATTFQYGGWVVANLLLKARPSESKEDGLAALMAWDNVICHSDSLGYVNASHQSGADHGPTVITWYHPLLKDDPKLSRQTLLQMTWDDWAAIVLADLSRAHPEIETLIQRMDIMRWGHAMIQPRVGFMFGKQRQQAAESLGRIHFAHSDLSGIALMEEAFARGVAAARKCGAS